MSLNYYQLFTQKHIIDGFREDFNIIIWRSLFQTELGFLLKNSLYLKSIVSFFSYSSLIYISLKVLGYSQVPFV